MIEFYWTVLINPYSFPDKNACFRSTPIMPPPPAIPRNIQIPAKQKIIEECKKKNGADAGANISKKDMEFLIAKASETAPAQTIRIEQGPVKIVPDK